MDDRLAVLVVEDDQDLRETLCAIIEAEGLATATASDGRAALEALRMGLRPLLILLDLMMPSMNGWEALSIIRSDYALADIPVAVLSAGSRARPPGATHFLPKPVDIDTLLDLVRSIQHVPGPSMTDPKGGQPTLDAFWR